MILRSATVADIPAMISLERQSSAAAHWAEQQYQQLFSSGLGVPAHLVLVADELAPMQSAGIEDSSTPLVGFLVARHLGPEWELENIVVASVVRRKGLGRRLLEALLAAARETNSEAVFLEVRDSNAAARALYEKSGFQLAGRRKSYYADPSEDAVLYRLDIASTCAKPIS